MPPTSAPFHDRPLLEGITVLDLASVGPAARASRWLADWGAEVLKIGPVPGDSGIQIVPPEYAYSAHRGIRRILINLKSEGGNSAFLRLAATADVVIESFRPGVISRLGIDYETLRAENPGIIVCSTTGFGQTGPRADWAAHDLNYLAISGYLHCSGRDQQGQPALPGATVADSAGGGLHAVAAICAALVARSTTGEGTHLDVSIAEGVLSLMSLAIDEYLAEGNEPGPRQGLLTGRYAWYDLYKASDGGWLAVAAIEPGFFANLCRGLGCNKWIDHQYDDEAINEMRSDFAAAFATRTRDEWVGDLGPAEACVTPVLAIPEVLEDEQFLARRAFTTVSHPVKGLMNQVAAPLAGQVDASEMVVHDQNAPCTDDILTAAGLGAEELATLRAEGAIA